MGATDHMPSKKTVWTLLGMWLLAYAWRPFLFGFYSDDYVLILQPVAQGMPASELFDFQMRNFANRPISGLVAFAYVRLLGDSAFLWHAASAVTCLLTGGLLWLILERLNRIENPVDEERLVWLTASWWLLPTSFGFVSWPAYVIHLPVVPLFLISFLILIRSPRLSWLPAASALFFYCLCLVTHESFYFQYLIPFTVLLVVRKISRLRWRNWVIWFSIFTLAQGSAIVFNRLSTIGTKKQFDAEFVFTRIVSVFENPRFLVHAVVPLLIAFVTGLLVLRIVRHLRLHSRPIPAGFPLTLIFVSGLLLSVLLYLSAGYSIRPFGLGSRTTICASIVAMLLLLQLLKHNSRFLHLPRAAPWSIPVVLALLSGIQAYHWHGSWRLQNEVMDQLPQRELLDLEKGAIVLCLVPNYHGHVMVFEDTWSLGPATWTHYPGLRQSRLQLLPHKNAGFRAAEVSFVGGKLTYRQLYTGHNLGSFRAGVLYVWNYYTGQLLRAEGDVVIPPHLDLRKFDLDNMIPVVNTSSGELPF